MAQSAIQLIQGPVGPAGPAGPAGGEALIFDFGGDNYDIPNNSDWSIGTPAAIIADPLSNALTVAAFDDTTEEGVGGELYVPTGARSLKINFVHKAATGPTGAQTVQYRFHFRATPDNAAIPGAWTTVTLDAMTIPDSDTDYFYELGLLDLDTIGMDTGVHYKWEITRYTSGTDTLTGDLHLLKTRIEVGTRSIKWFPADTMASATNSDWAVNANAPIATDSNNAALKVRRHDDTTEEGSGITLYVPRGATKLRLHIVSRGENASSGDVGVKMYYREIPDNLVVDTWRAKTLASHAVALPSNEYFQYDYWELTLPHLATPIDAESQYQFQITRDAGDANDTYVGDWSVLAYGFEFYEDGTVEGSSSSAIP